MEIINLKPAFSDSRGDITDLIDDNEINAITHIGLQKMLSGEIIIISILFSGITLFLGKFY